LVRLAALLVVGLGTTARLGAQPVSAPRGAIAPATDHATPAPAAASTLPPVVSDAIDRLFAPYAGDSTPGYAVAVLRDGRPAFWKGYGMANLDELAPITPATAFNVASLSKQFTAACLALVILDGKVRLEDTAAAYVPASPSTTARAAARSSSSTWST
jgi:CubicO group peptidase (beta-lactamase class C family)